MTKRVMILAILLVMSLPLTVMAAEPGSGTIEGQVVNKTAGGGTVAGQQVTLTTRLNDNETETATAETDSGGKFVFNNLPTESGYGYRVKLTYQQAEYTTDWLNFSEGETAKSAEVTVYDSTTSDEAITLDATHTLIYVGTDTLQIKQYFYFINGSDRTYIGSKEVTGGKKQTLLFSVPVEATGLNFDVGFVASDLFKSGNGFGDTTPILPGERDVAFSYSINYDQGTHVFSQKMDYAAGIFNLLVSGEGLNIESDQLVTNEPLDMGGTLFNYLSAKNLQAGSVVAAKIATQTQAVDNNQWFWLWLVLALTALVAGLVFYYLRRRRKLTLQPVSSGSGLEPGRNRLLAEIARLDDDFEWGKIEEDAYRKQRAEKKAKLLRLIKSNGG